MWEKLVKGKKVVVGMSGGVDSSVAALLLKQAGAEVIGLFMKNWDEKDENGQCQATKDYEDVARVCDKIDIPYYSINFVKQYHDQVFSHFVEEYKKGHTPNPDILCNREIKFKVFLEQALLLGADYLATGHYCDRTYDGEKTWLKKAKDLSKDQSYFLGAIKEEALKKSIFPLGQILKKQVREIAEQYQLATHDKKDSTGICFIGERNFKNFISNYISAQQGDFKTLDGEVVGKHDGMSFYTIGQRKGLGLGGPGEPWFVVKKDVEQNIVYVERGVHHPALYADGLTATELSWITEHNIQLPYACKAKIRYRQEDQECIIEKIEGDKLHVRFLKPQRAVTPRQLVVFYKDDICLGGAMIEKSVNNYYELGLPVLA